MMDPKRVYYVQNRTEGIGLNAGSSPVEGYIPLFWITKKEHQKNLDAAYKEYKKQQDEKIKLFQKEISEIEKQKASIEKILNTYDKNSPEDSEKINISLSTLVDYENLINEKSRIIETINENMEAIGPLESDLPKNLIKISKEDYIEFCRDPGEFVYDGKTVLRATDEEKVSAEAEREQKAEEKRNEPECIRAERLSEFKMFDKYHYLIDELTEQQLNEFLNWREAWKNAPETKVRPKRPDWFREM